MPFDPPADWRRVCTVDAHTAGEPLRVILEGFPELEGDSILAVEAPGAASIGHLTRVSIALASGLPGASTYPALALLQIPLGMLPHLGNKVWALRDDRDRYRFVRLAFGVGLTLGLMGLGGILARAVLGDALLVPGRSANEALPTLFVTLFPTWLAALVGVGVLSAIMSTADGLVVSSSQIVANDLYRRSIVPRLGRSSTRVSRPSSTSAST